MKSPTQTWPYWSAARALPAPAPAVSVAQCDAWLGAPRAPIPDATQRAALGAWAGTLKSRLAAAREVERHAGAAAKESVEFMRAKYQQFDKKHDHAWAKHYRDVELFSRVMVQAMILGDLRYQDEKVFYWVRTILAAFDFTPGFNRDTYTSLSLGFEKRLSPEAWPLFKPCLDRLIQTMTDFPAPANPRV